MTRDILKWSKNRFKHISSGKLVPLLTFLQGEQTKDELCASVFINWCLSICPAVGGANPSGAPEEADLYSPGLFPQFTAPRGKSHFFLSILLLFFFLKRQTKKRLEEWQVALQAKEEKMWWDRPWMEEGWRKEKGGLLSFFSPFFK